MPRNDLSVMIRAQLCQNLPESLKTLVQFSYDKPLDDLVNCLDQAYKPQSEPIEINYSSSVANNRPTYSHSNYQSRGASSFRSGNGRRASYHGQQHRTNFQGNNSDRKGKIRQTCSYCNRFGHHFFDCRSRLSDQYAAARLEEHNNKTLKPRGSKPSAEAYKLAAEPDDNDPGNSEFPFLDEAEASTISLPVKDKTTLLFIRCNVSIPSIGLDGIDTIALLDSGATPLFSHQTS